MKERVSKNTKRVIGVILIVIILGLSITMVKRDNDKLPKRLKDKEFSLDSKIRIENLSNIQEENLYTLAKVWGFVKYRHPSITNGDINWDMELFRVMPEVIRAKSKEEAQSFIVEWLNQFPFEIPEVDTEGQQEILKYEKQKILGVDLSWIQDQSFLGADLSNYLKKLKEVMVLNTKNSYAVINNDGFINLEAESSYQNMKPEDSGMRLLSLFRYWNIIEYYYPYKDIIEEDWDQVLHRMIPVFIQEKDARSYVLAVSELTTFIHDSHAATVDNQHILEDYFGLYTPTVEFLNINGKIVISKVAENDKEEMPLQPGDIVLSMDGDSIEDRIKKCKKYISLSNENRFVYKFHMLLGTNDREAKIEVLRENKKMIFTVPCTMERQSLSGNEESELIEEGRIGYINPETLKKGQIDLIMEEFKNTKGLIVDLRNYPSDNIVYSLAEYLIPERIPFAKSGSCNSFIPGDFYMNKSVSSGRENMNTSDAPAQGQPLYKGKVVLLMDERTQSHGEFTIMSLRNAPEAVVIGSPSIGADGNAVYISLPGNTITKMTGLSVFYPDGRQTQRVGLEPDIYVMPTVEGLKEGRDELMEKAISLVNGNGQ